MSAWRDMLARFRKDPPEHDPDSTIAVLDAAPPNTVIEPLQTDQPGEAVPPPALRDEDATRSFGDTTRSLATTAPQLAAMLNERVLAAAALRDIGRERHENQDHCYAQILTLPTDERTVTIGLFAVADGMGGHHDGGYASRLAITTVVRTILDEFIDPILDGKQLAPQPVAQAAVQAANAAVFAAGQTAGSDMGTTCTVALLYDHEIVVAHVGDSRALLIGGGVKQLTTDHTAVGRLIAIGALTPEEAHDHPLRNQLYRSVGQQADVPVDVTTTPLHGETHLVLCSDGLWGLVPDAEIADIVIEAPTPQLAARHLIARANLLGGHDNISAVVVTLPAAEGAAT